MERRLAAVFFADLVGYSRRMEQDEPGTFVLVKSVLETIFQPQILQFKGRIIKVMGDCVMAEFPSVLDAVHCAISVQAALADRNVDLEPDDQVAYRIGVNLGDIILDGGDVYGEMVNIAARVESLAGPGEVWVTRPVRDQIRDRIDFPLEDRGSIKVKNISRPVRVFRLLAGDVDLPRRAGWRLPTRLTICGAALAALLLFAGQLQFSQAPESEPSNAPLAEAAPENPLALKPKSGSYVTLARTNLRQGPGTGFDVVRTVDPGTPFELSGLIEDENGDWYKVRGEDEDEDYFVFSRLLSPAETPQETVESSNQISLDVNESETSSAEQVEVVTSRAPDADMTEEADPIWFRVVVDASNGAWNDCGVYGGSSIHSLSPDQLNVWMPVSLKDGPDIALKVRALDEPQGVVIEVWPFSRDWPESRRIPVSLPGLQPGSSGRAFSSGRALAPLEFCGAFSVYVDVVEQPEEG
ncbi:MAG: adenylate/guanylate cyclase domain-containing protein [Pseudomonadota bacterium]